MKRFLIIILLLSSSAPHIMAQGSRQALLADSLYRYSSYAKAIRHYEKAIRKDESPDLLLGLANSHFKLQEYSQAIDIYKQVDRQNAAWKVQDKINYIESLRIMGEDDEMDRLLEQWNTIPESKESVYKNSLQAMDLFYMDSAVYNVKAAKMNSEYSEFSPVYYGDGILFASSRSEGNTSNKKYHWNQENYLDLYFAKENDSIVQSFSVNTKFHDGPVAFYNDGKKVIFTRNEDVSKRKDQRQLGLYHADVSASGSWENIKPLELNHPDYSVSHPSVSADGRKLYFVSNKPGGFGGTDIYVALKNGDQWTNPQNLGPDINTSGNEMFPAIFGEELFFASDGHPGLGGLDIFISEKLDKDSYFVRNAGYPLNSTWDDFSLVTRDGRNGYFATNRNGNDDLFAFTKDKIIVEITYIDPEENVLDSVMTDFNGRSIPQGRDKMTRIYMDRESINELKAFKTAFADTTYEIQTHDEFFISKTIQLRPLSDEDMLRGTVDIYPIAINNTDYDLFMGQEEKLLRADEGNNWKKHFVLRKEISSDSNDKLSRIKSLLEGNGYTVRVHDKIDRIHFDFDKWDIRPSEYDKLNRVAELLNTYPQTQVIIGAHTDERGSDAYNMKLSRKRAKSTVDYLIGRGVKSKRMTSRAFGESMLWIVCAPCSEDQHQENRRVTFDVSIDEQGQ